MEQEAAAVEHHVGDASMKMIEAVTFGVIAIMLQFVIPTFQDMFREFGSEDGLPWLTQKVIGFSVWFRNNVHWLFIIIIAVVVLLIRS